MSRRRPEVRVRLDGLLSEGQLEIVGEIVVGQLIGQAGDLDHLDQYRDPRRAIREVAALARLAFWLEYQEILVPDRVARDLMARTAREMDEMDRSGESTGGDPPAEHDAMAAFVGLLSDWPAGAEVHDALWRGQTSAGSKADGER